VRHSERYEEIGEVSGAVIDLDARWRAEQDEVRNVVRREEARFMFETELDSPPAEVWEAMTSPEHGMRWRVGVDDIRESNPAGERGVGTVTHCVHGRRTIEQEIVDWLPPHHVSFSERNPIGACLWTMSLAPLDGGSRTRIEWRIALRGGRGQAALVRVIGGRVRGILRQNFESLVAYLQASPGRAGTLGRS
jgi:uncharacterized protein YndB with AHSA1/START domain